VTKRAVEPVPPRLADVARRIAARAGSFGALGKDAPVRADAVPDAVTVLHLEPGDFLPPSLPGEGGAFERPFYILAVDGRAAEDAEGSGAHGGAGDAGGGEVLLLGVSIKALPGAPGEFEAGFAQRLERRSLLAMGGRVGRDVAHAVPAVAEPTTLFIFRRMTRATRAEMAAIGNCA
jgi:hypothetical protein